MDLILDNQATYALAQTESDQCGGLNLDISPVGTASKGYHCLTHQKTPDFYSPDPLPPRFPTRAGKAGD